MFMKISNFKYAGMVYEQMGDFKQAAGAFEQAEDNERASYCYERSGDMGKAQMLRENSQISTGLDIPAKSSSIANFSISEGSQEATMIISQQKDEHAKKPERDLKPKNFTLPLNGNVGVFSLDPPAKVNSSSLDPDKMLFHECKLFSELDFQQRSRIWDLGLISEAKPGTILVDWSEEPQGFHFVLDGELDCILNSESGEVPLETIAKGDTFGEIWLLAEKPASVRLMARTNCRILIIERDKFLEMLDQDGTIARKVYKHFTHRLLGKLLNPWKPQDIRHAS
jgi:hypothetical protein